MATITNNLRLTPAQQAELDTIKTVAKVRHEKARRAAKKRGATRLPPLAL